MQTTPDLGLEANRRLDSTCAMIVWWVLVVVSCCAALAAFFLVIVSANLTGDILAAPIFCEPSKNLIDEVDHSFLAGGAAGLLSLGCAVASRRSRAGSTTGARRTASTLLILFSSLAVVLPVCSYCNYFGSVYGKCDVYTAYPTQPSTHSMHAAKLQLYGATQYYTGLDTKSGREHNHTPPRNRHKI